MSAFRSSRDRAIIGHTHQDGLARTFTLKLTKAGNVDGSERGGHAIVGQKGTQSLVRSEDAAGRALAGPPAIFAWRLASRVHHPRSISHVQHIGRPPTTAHHTVRVDDGSATAQLSELKRTWIALEIKSRALDQVIVEARVVRAGATQTENQNPGRCHKY